MQALLLIALLAASPDGDARDPFAEDFEEAANPGIALGPLPSGGVLLSADLGYLRSALRAQVGLGRQLDIVAWTDAFLLRDLFSEQNGAHVGLRWTPVAGERLRVSVEGSGGVVFAVGPVVTATLFALRAEGVGGWTFRELGTAYARLTFRGLTDAAAGRAHWGRDQEVALGVERTFGKLVAGAEASLWSRPDLDTITQWRLRVGYRL